MATAKVTHKCVTTDSEKDFFSIVFASVGLNPKPLIRKNNGMIAILGKRINFIKSENTPGWVTSYVFIACVKITEIITIPLIKSKEPRLIFKRLVADIFYAPSP